MRHRPVLFMLGAMVTVALVAPYAQTSSNTPSSTCESLAKVVLPDATIQAAEAVAAGFAPPGGRGGRGRAPAAPLPPFCRVTATLTPTPTSDIKVEMWLPLEWNGRLLEVGNGGWAGSINYGGMSTALSAGFATASTDTGHTGGSASFAVERPEAVIDYGYRSVHEMTLKAKQLISSFYGRAAQFSYWDGCSTGGKQGLTEAQRYPEDFNGIVAGAPANYHTFNVATDVDLADTVDAGVNNATNPNLAPFFTRGGKLLMYHGWSDHHISPANSINYYNSVLKAVPDPTMTSSSIRLFMAPGMAHCGGGDGPDTFDRVGAIRAWVENGTAPDRLMVTKASGGQVTRSRPLCSYPQVAKWSGTGSIDEAANVSCVPPTAPSSGR